MNVKTLSISRRAGVAAGSLFALASAMPLALCAAESAGALSAATNYIKFSGQNAWVEDSKSTWQTENRQSKNGVGGIEELKIDQRINDKALMQFDARVLPGNDDYLGIVRLKVEDSTTVEVGYKNFRTWYDGVGGFFPTNGAWKPLADQYLHTDRSSFWVDAKVALPDKPVFHFRYSVDKRDGQKDSTIWGDTDMTGLRLYAPYTSWSSGNRKLVANYIDLDEQTDTFEASMHHKIGKTTLDVAVVRTAVDNLDTRMVNRYPGELQPYPRITIGATTVSAETKANNHIGGWDTQGVDNETWAFSAKFETEINSKVTVFGGVLYSTTDGAVYGDRQMWVDMATVTGTKTLLAAYAAGGRPAYSYTTTGGDLDHQVFSANLGVNLKLMPALFITAGVKSESVTMDVSNDVLYKGTLVVTTTGVTTPTQFAAKNFSHVSEDVWIPEIKVRYNGIKGVSLYGNADYRYVPADETTYNDTASINNVIAKGTLSTDEVREHHGNYKLGVSWAVTPMVTLRAETFLKDHENRFGDTSLASGFFILDSTMKGAVLAATLTPRPELSCTTRYTLRSGSTDLQVNKTLGSYESSTTKAHLISESITWSPSKAYYAQADITYVFDSTNTSYLRAGDVTTGTVTAPVYRFANRVLSNADNNYWTGSVVGGVNVTQDTNVELKGVIYRSNNYQPGFAAYTLPYGMSQRNSQVTLGVKHRFSEKLAGEAKVGAFKSENDTTGGKTDYSGVLAYVSLTRAF